MSSREKFEEWGMSDVDLRITLESETYAGIAWMAWQAAIASMQSERDQLAAQLADVVAENAALKDAIQTHSESVHFCEVCGKDDPCSTDDVCYVLKETPATDRFIAEQLRNEVKV